MIGRLALFLFLAFSPVIKHLGFTTTNPDTLRHFYFPPPPLPFICKYVNTASKRKVENIYTSKQFRLQFQETRNQKTVAFVCCEEKNGIS